MPSDNWEMPPITGREVRVSCGCRVTDMLARVMTTDGVIATGRETVIFPCDAHTDVAREIAQTVGTKELDEVAAAIEAVAA